jgi:hypothetical protein
MKNNWIMLGVLVGTIGFLILSTKLAKADGCNLYSPGSPAGPWGAMTACPDCDAWRTINDNGCAGPALPTSSCVLSSLPAEEDELCVSGRCQSNTVGYSNYEPCHVTGTCSS